MDNTVFLNTNREMPLLGLGVYKATGENEAENAIISAVESGYRLIDTAQAYGNERGVGEGIRTGGVQREELFVVSKVAAGHKTYEDKCRGFPVYDGKI